MFSKKMKEAFRRALTDDEITDEFDSSVDSLTTAANSSSERYLFPADPSLTAADVNKLLMNDGSDTAKVYQRTPAVFPTAQADFLNAGRVHTDPVANHFRLKLLSQPNDGDVLDITANHVAVNGSPFAGYQQIYRNSPAGGSEVQIGATIPDTLNNIVTAILASTLNTTISNNGEIAHPITNAVSDGVDTITFTIGNTDSYTGAGSNFSYTMPSQPRGMAVFIDTSSLATNGRLQLLDVVSNSLMGSTLWGPQNGINEVQPSVFQFSDTVTGSIITSTAGVDWTPGVDAAASALSVFNAVESAIQAAGWSISLNLTTISLQYSTAQSNSSSISDPNGTGLFNSSSVSGSSEASSHKPLGILQELRMDGLALIASPAGRELIFSAGGYTQGCDANAILVGGSDGGVTTPQPNALNTTDYAVGVSRSSAQIGEAVIVDYVPRDANLWSGTPPKTIEEAIDRLAEFLAQNLGQPF